LPPAVLALAAASFAIGTQAFAFVGLLAEMATDLHTSIGTAGKLIAIYALLFAVAAPLIATRTLTRERRGMIVVGLLLVTLANLASAAAPNFWTLSALRIVAALGAATVMPLASTAAAALAPPEMRGRALALVVSGITLAFLAGIPIGAAIGGAFGWRAIFIFTTALAGAAALVVRLAVPPVPPPPGTSGNLRTLVMVMSDRRVAPVVATTAVSFAAIFNINAFIGPITTALTGATGAGVGFFQAFIGVGALVGVPIGGYLADRAKRSPAPILLFVVIAATLSAYSLLLIHATGALPWPVLAALVFTAAAALFSLVPTIQARLLGVVGPLAPVALALNGSALSLGQGLGATVGGFVIDEVGLWAVGFAGAIIAVAGAFLAASWATARD
jgi:DHA1 family inner membrane transport protein